MVSNEQLTSLATAREKIQESVRDLETLKLELPLGNPGFKNVHTNQFLWLDLPDEFVLENMPALAKALNSSAARWSGYEKNRWYIEGITITNDGDKLTAELDLNPFASSLSSYRDERNSFIKAFKDLEKEKESEEENNNSNNSNTSVKSVGGKNSTLKGGEGEVIDNLVKEIVGNETDELEKAKLVHGWLQRNVEYSGYACTRYSTPESCLNNKTHLNCADTARLTASMMRSAGLYCYVVHNTNGVGHFWVVIEIDGQKYASDQTGSGSEWNTVWNPATEYRSGNGGYTEYHRNNGDEPDC